MDFNENFKKALPIALYYNHHDSSVQKVMSKKIHEFYFKNRKLVPETYQNLTNVSK